VALAKQLKHEHERGTELGLHEDEIAFYDAYLPERLRARLSKWATRC
jgi:Domain of unknown function (DUF3387)